MMKDIQDCATGQASMTLIAICAFTFLMGTLAVTAGWGMVAIFALYIGLIFAWVHIKEKVLGIPTVEEYI